MSSVPLFSWLSCFSSFPETSNEEADLTYTFRFPRVRNPSKRGSKRKTCSRSGESKVRYYYCYCFFRQLKDASNSRGYLQKSVVLVSPLSCIAYGGLLEQAVKIIAFSYFEVGADALKAAYLDIAKWPISHTDLVPFTKLPLLVRQLCRYRYFAHNRVSRRVTSLSYRSSTLSSRLPHLVRCLFLPPLPLPLRNFCHCA